MKISSDCTDFFINSLIEKLAIILILPFNFLPYLGIFLSICMDKVAANSH
nr:MAG TPA: hypothetical protein [Caudoviricetes sp.]